jgi:hypothetical protein
MILKMAPILQSSRAWRRAPPLCRRIGASRPVSNVRPMKVGGAGRFQPSGPLARHLIGLAHSVGAVAVGAARLL